MNGQQQQKKPQVKIPPMPNSAAILKKLRIDTGLEEPPENPRANPFASDVPQPPEKRAKAPTEQLWDPMISKSTADQRGKREEDSLIAEIEDNEIFKQMAPQIDDLLTKISDEIVNPESVYGEKEGQEDFAIQLQDLIAGMNKEGDE
jgi:hypothetical protein